MMTMSLLVWFSTTKLLSGGKLQDTHKRDPRFQQYPLLTAAGKNLQQADMTYLAIIDLGYSKLKPATDRVSNFLVSVYGKAIETRYTTK